MKVAAHNIDPSKISEELSKVWQQLQGRLFVRCSLINLLIYSDLPYLAAYIDEVLHKVVLQVPCRIFWIEIREIPEIKVDIEVLLQEQNIACDVIKLAGSQKDIDALRSLILAHLIPDLPLYAMWFAPLIEHHPILESLRGYVEVLIADSNCESSFSQFLSRWKPFLQDTLSCPSFAKKCTSNGFDLNWSRTENWRNLLVATLSNQKSQEDLKQLTSIKICYNNKKVDWVRDATLPIVYFGAWLVNQLDLLIKEVHTDSIIVESGQKIELCPVDLECFPPAVLVSVEIISKNSSYLFVRDQKSPRFVKVTVCSNTVCQEPLQRVFPPSDIGTSLMRILENPTETVEFSKIITLLTHVKCTL